MGLKLDGAQNPSDEPHLPIIRSPNKFDLGQYDTESTVSAGFVRDFEVLNFAHGFAIKRHWRSKGGGGFFALTKKMAFKQPAPILTGGKSLPPGAACLRFCSCSARWVLYLWGPDRPVLSYRGCLAMKGARKASPRKAKWAIFA